MSWDPVWEDVFQSQAWGKYPAESLIRFVARNYYKAPNRADVRILEVGCGPGANLWFVAREGFTPSGIDGSPTAIEQANARLDLECIGWRDRGGEIVVGDATKLPWRAGTFDAVIDVECAYSNSFEASQGIYQEMARVAKPGGMLYSRTFAARSWGDGTGRKVGRNAWFADEGPSAGKGLTRYTSLDEIPELVRGFDVQEVEEISYTTNERRNVVREWIIIGRKPSV